MKKLILIVMVLMLALIPVAGAQGDPAMVGAGYITSTQNEDGSWGTSDALGNLPGTTLALVALGSIGQMNEAGLTALEPVVADNLDTLEIDNLAGVVLAVVAQGGDPTNFAGTDLVAKLNEMMQAARGENVADLCIGLAAVASSGGSLNSMALQGLTSMQNEDGSFQETADDASLNLLTTAMCADVLAYAGETEALTAALDYLRSVQNEDGGWGVFDPAVSDAVGTEYALIALLSADEDLSAWGSPESLLYSYMDQATGAVYASPEMVVLPDLTLISTALATMIFRGETFTSLAPDAATDEAGATEEASAGNTTAGGDAPALDAAEWAPVLGGFGMAELDTADDFFVTVVDPFTDDELYGVEILNWVAEYKYTGYIVEEHLPAEVLLWMAEQDPTTWELISPSLLAKLPAEELAKLPAEVQAMAGE